MRADRVSQLIPFVQVADVRRSIDFYCLLGFEVRDTYTLGDRLDWAALASGDCRLMLAQAGGPVDPRGQGVLFYLYAEDLDGLRAHLVAGGLTPAR